jgi:L-lysine 6-transaminase
MPKYPGPLSATRIAELQKCVIVEPYPFVLDIERAHGMWLHTIDNQEIFDWAGYYASKLIGHNHPALSEPAYLKRLANAANNKLANPDFLTPECVDYYTLVHSLAPKCMANPKLEIYAVNSGAEAVENMMKYFINLHREKLVQKRTMVAARRFVYFEEAFHGRTVFALNVTRLGHDPVITKDFHGFIPGNTQVPFPSINTDETAQKHRELTQKSLSAVEDILKRYGDEVVGIIVEPMQGAGGHRIAEPEFFQGLSHLAKKYDVYLGFDEVQTAGGNIGTMFAADMLNLPHPPDAIAVAKKFGCGVVFMNHSMNDFGVLDSTWGGTLADMVRFVQEMRVVKSENLIEQVPQKTKQLVAGLQDLQKRYPGTICNIRGWGLYQGFSFSTPQQKSQFIDNALEREDMLLLGAGTHSVRLRPNLSVTNADIALFLEKTERLLAALPKDGTP